MQARTSRMKEEQKREGERKRFIVLAKVITCPTAFRFQQDIWNISSIACHDEIVLNGFAIDSQFHHIDELLLLLLLLLLMMMMAGRSV